jgi:PIN domain nuclease of toxin-antitoxin system
MRSAAPPPAVLLDTCALIWITNADTMTQPAIGAIFHAGRAQGIFVSPISAWQIGLATRPRATRSPSPQFLPDPKTWFARAMTGPGLKAAPFTPEIAIDASHLPGSLHGDPGDRLLIATARYLGFPIVTRDRRIIEYGAAGYLDVIAC